MKTCPRCKSKKGMMKAGWAYASGGKKLVRYKCLNKRCCFYTVKPIE